ncbi:MAG TPA: MBL fold metallo-hydrolase [Xanthobacteraceae bacterium]|nr:MBL fold metallo-hydrolase [Xanthobacteraceae bacterium]
MLQTRMIGDVRVSRVLEMSGPTHDPAFLFPDLPPEEIARQAHWLAPHHWVPAMGRLIITTQIWVVQTGSRVVLVDTAIGNGKPRPAARQNMLNTLVEPWLIAAGAAPEAVTDVVLTHLHADHVGWNTRLEDGRFVPSFPNARYHVPRQDFEVFQARFVAGEKGVNSGSFADSVLPIFEAGLADFIAPGDIVAERLRVAAAPGHTPGQINLWLTGVDEPAVFCADIFHSPLQIALPALNTRYCMLPDVARRTRIDVLNESARTGALIMPMHFGAPHCGYVRAEGDAFRFEPANW